MVLEEAGGSGFVCRYETEFDRTRPMTITEQGNGAWEAFESGPFRLFQRPAPTTREAEADGLRIVDTSLLLVYSGRLDNRRELAYRLGSPELRQQGDGHFFARAYEEWDVRFPAMLLGEYAFALFDPRRGRFVAGRDSLGTGRLYSYRSPGAIWVASSMDLLLEALPERPQWSRPGLAEYFAGGGLMMSGQTIYEGLREVPAAHVLVHTEGSDATVRYWEPKASERLRWRDAREYDEALRVLLFDAVEAALRSNSRVFSDLSGGLDSSGVTSVAAQLRSAGTPPSEGLTAFSMYTTEAPNDERFFQHSVVEAYGIDHVSLLADEHLSFSTTEEPRSAHPSKAILYRPLWDAVAAEFEAGGAVAHLTGQGGDAVFCGDDFPPAHLGELVRRLKLGQWYREMREWGVGDRSYANLLWYCSSGRPVDTYAGALKGHPPAWLNEEFREEVAEAEESPWRPNNRLYESPARELHYRLITQSAAIASLIQIGDERRPLLYRPLVEFALSLPWEHLIKPTEDRVIQRRALGGILPDVVRERVTKATGTPLLLRGIRENWESAKGLAAGELIADFGLVEPKAFGEAFLRFRHGILQRRLRYFIAAASFEIWLQANQEDTGPRPLAEWFLGLAPRLPWEAAAPAEEVARSRPSPRGSQCT